MLVTPSRVRYIRHIQAWFLCAVSLFSSFASLRHRGLHAAMVGAEYWCVYIGSLSRYWSNAMGFNLDSCNLAKAV